MLSLLDEMKLILYFGCVTLFYGLFISDFRVVVFSLIIIMLSLFFILFLKFK